MNGDIDVVTLLFLVLAVVIFLKLRSVLGRKTGEEQQRYEQSSRERNRARAEKDQDKIVTLPRRDNRSGDTATGVMNEVSYEEQEKKIKEFTKEEKLADALISIFRIDRSFAPDEFLAGAKSAYEMIVSSFAEGNRKVLKGLLSKDVFEGFSSAIAEREKKNEKIDQNFVGISKADIIDAKIDGKTAQITVKFVSELISATMDKSGKVISGDPNAITEVTDVWTFARDLNSRDPNWRLVATQAAS